MPAALGKLVTYNWNPQTQLANLIADEASVAAGGKGSSATVAFLGDSTTDGFGTAASNYIATTSLPAQVAAGLLADGVSANQADFMGQGNELSIDTDARVTLIGGASWNFPIAAGGEVVRFGAAGDGVSFAPGAGTYGSLTLDYIDVGGASFDVKVDGKDLGDIVTGGTGLLAQATLQLPAPEAVSNVTITDINGGSGYLEGVTLAAAAASVQVVDDGVGGAASSIVGAGQPETTPYDLTSINAVAAEKPTVAFVDFGINDVLQGLTAAQTTANLKLIVQELQAVGTEAVIVMPNPITAAGWNTEIGTLRTDVDALATQLGVPVIDLSATSGDNAAALQAAGLLGGDGVHPTAAYDAMAGQQIADLLAAAIRAPGAPAASSSGAGSTMTGTGTVTPAAPIGVHAAVSASAFLGSLGVDTHIPYTDGGYASVSNVLADLRYIGVGNVRDGLSDGHAANGQYNGSAPLSSFETLARAGIRFTTIIGAGGAWTPQAVQAVLVLDEQLQQAVPGAVAAIEGANEINNAPVTWTPAGGASESGLQAGIDLQKDLYAAVHGDPALPGVAVDYFTGYGAGSVAQGPDPATQPGLADYDTQHPYPQSQDAGYWTAPSLALSNEPGAQGPAVYTETGYSTATVSQLAQAQGDLDILLDDARNGVSKTFLYQLMDAYQPGSPQGDDGYGLFAPGNQPKLAATALHDLTSILADPGGSASQAAVPTFTVSGLPADGRTLAIGKSDGTQDFAVWNETSGSRAVTVALGAYYQSVSVYDPLQGSAPIQTFSAVNSVALTLDGSPLIVQVGLVATPIPPPAPVALSLATVTLGSGPDILALRISQDAYLGNAQFTVAVGGVQVGGVQTVSAAALHSSGTDQTFDVLGNFSASQQVSVSFLNDLYAGTPQTDRNLYIDGATIDGAVVAGAVNALFGDWTRSFAVANPAVPAAATAPVAMPTQTGSDAPTLGSGPDTLALQISQDAYQGNAQYLVAVNGLQFGGVQTVSASASQAAGTTQTLELRGNFSGYDQVSIQFLNDLYAGTPATDRNLYVDGATIDGSAIKAASLAIDGDWTRGFSFQGPSGASTPMGGGSASANPTAPGTSAGPAMTLGSGPDTLALHVSQDAFQGNAQFVVDVDGQQVGGVQTVDGSALHSAGADQTFNVLGSFAGATSVGVNFLNDLYAGSPATDRNLYVDGATIDGVTVGNAKLTELGDGRQGFSFIGPHQARVATSPDVGLYLTGSAGVGAQWSIDGGALSQLVAPPNGAPQGYDIGSLSAGVHDLALYQVPNPVGGSGQGLYVDQVTVGSARLAGLSYGAVGTGTTHFALNIPTP